MIVLASIFLEFNLPNPTTWFYFSLLLAVALFFKFSRLLSMRNWDVVTLFLLVPGMLLLKEARTPPSVPEEPDRGGVRAAVEVPETPSPAAQRLAWFGYLWLLSGSAYFLVRCFVDLALVRRPALTPNMSLSGLAWLGGTLFVFLVAVALQRPGPDRQPVGKESTAIHKIKEAPRRAVGLVSQETGFTLAADLDLPLGIERGLAMLCHLAVVVALVLIGWLHFQDTLAGMAAATFYLLLPYTAYQVEQVHHAWPMALMLWAVLTYRRPMLAGLFLGLAAGSVYFPVLLAPIWFSFYWRRGAWRFLAAFVLATGLSLGGIAALLWMDGQLARSLQTVLALSDWQPWLMPSAEGFWTGLHWAYRLPVFIAYMALVIATLFWPAPKNLAHVLALSAVVLIGIQFWYADQGGVYVLWYLPLLLLMVFRPNLSDRRPPQIQPETDWLVRFNRRVVRSAAGLLLKVPEPLARVQ